MDRDVYEEYQTPTSKLPPLPPPSPPPDQLFSLPKSSRGATTTTPLSHIRPFFGYGQPVVREIRAISVVPKIALAFHDDLTIEQASNNEGLSQ